MKTIVPDSLAPGLTDIQLKCLHALRDGNWHDHNEIGRKTRTYIPANISGRIIGPLCDKGIAEQEERPVKEGSRKKKKFVRIRQDVNARNLHLLIQFSANDLILKYNRKKQPETANFFLKIRDESIRKLVELEKLEEEHRETIKEEYWANMESRIPYSESWPELITAAKKIADHFEKALKPLEGLPWPPYQRTLAEIIEGIPSTAFLTACEANPTLWKKIQREAKRHEWMEYFGIDIDVWGQDRGISPK